MYQLRKPVWTPSDVPGTSRNAAPPAAWIRVDQPPFDNLCRRHALECHERLDMVRFQQGCLQNLAWSKSRKVLGQRLPFKSLTRRDIRS